MPLGFSRTDRAGDKTYPSVFRPDIQGLRALAALSVVFFDLKVSGFGGGFTGVGIFFVISGYLITRSILGDAHFDRFTFANFYARRVHRIFPAMLATVAVTIVAGGLWFPPSKLVTTAQSALSSLAFVSNIYFLVELEPIFFVRFMSVDNMLIRVQAKFPATVSLVLPVNYMCDGNCPIIRDRLWLYENGGHMTVAGSLRFAERADDAIADFLSGKDQFAEGQSQIPSTLKQPP